MAVLDVKVVEMYRHFLYLPVYVAYRNNFFNLIPSKYKISRIERSHPTHGSDEKAFERLMKSGSDERIYFAVCDPTTVFNALLNGRSYQSKPVILATLVTNGGCWAVNKNSHEISRIKDLGEFSKIISYGEGSTTYGMAMRVLYQANKMHLKSRILNIVSPMYELGTLETMSMKGIDAVAITPNILDFERLRSRRRSYRIVYHFPRETEYKGVMVTGVLSRTDIVEHYPDLVQGFLLSMKEALGLVRNRDNNVIMMASKYFGYDVPVVREALETALSCEVLPDRLNVNKAEWLNAVKANCLAQDIPLDDELESQALEIYNDSIEAFSDFAEKADRRPHFRSIVEPPPRRVFPEEERWSTSAISLLKIPIIVGLSFWIYWLAWPIIWNGEGEGPSSIEILVIAISAAIIVAAPSWVYLKSRSPGMYFVYLVVTLLDLLLWHFWHFWHTYQEASGIILLSASVLLGAQITTVVKYAGED